MKIQKRLIPLPVIIAAAALAACGGGSGTDTAGSAGGSGGTTGTSPTPVSAIGAITGFGSVFVNGVRYEVAPDTLIIIEDQMEMTGDDSMLRLGMKVEIAAVNDNGSRTATRIEYDDDLKGPITAVNVNADDPTTGTFVVLNQVVTVDSNTIFDDDVGNNDGISGIDIRDLQIGMFVEVSGFPTNDGFAATRVDRERFTSIGDPGVDGDEVELKGFVEAVADDLGSITVSGVVFLINANTVTLDGIVISADLVGAFVEVKADVVAGDFIAVRIEREDDFGDRNGEFEIEGILISVDTNATPNTFTVNGITVEVTNASVLVDLVGQRVEIKGSFNADGVLVIRLTQREDEENIRTEDLVASIDTGALSFTTRLGLVIAASGNSRISDDAGDNGDHLTAQQFIDRLQPGDRIEARGVGDGDGGVEWTRIERDEAAGENDDFECELQGAVESISGDVNAFSFVIRGVTVETGRVDNDDFEDELGFPIGRAAFFERLREGSLVKSESFEGDAFCMPALLDAREVEFEFPFDD